MTMKRSFFTLVLMVMVAAFSAHAQSPVIYGINQSNGLLPEAYTWWSIYGQNLSTITNTSCSGWGSTVHYSFPLRDSDGDVTIFDQNPASACSDPSYWYESSGQINFYANVFVPNAEANNTFRITDPSSTYGQTLYVCNSLGLCSAPFHYD